MGSPEGQQFLLCLKYSIIYSHYHLKRKDILSLKRSYLEGAGGEGGGSGDRDGEHM